MMAQIELPGCWTREDVQEAAGLAGPWAKQSRWPPEAVLLFLLNWALDNRQHTFERYLPEAWPMIRCLVEGWSLPMAGAPVTAAALCQVRQRLRTAPLEALHRKANAWVAARLDGLCRWDGLRVWALDGSWINLPSEPGLEREFGRPSGTSQAVVAPFPQALLVGLEMVHAGWVFDYRIKGCNEAELAAGRELSRGLGREDLLLADRGFFDSCWFSELRGRGVEMLVRVSSTRWKSFCNTSRERIEALRAREGDVDCTVMLKVDTDGKGRPRGGLLPLRYIERLPHAPGQETMRLITSLPEERLSARQSGVLYAERWGIETQFRLLKGQDHLPVVLSRKPETVRQEIQLRLLAHNWIRSLQAEACLRSRASSRGAFPPYRHDTGRTSAVRQPHGLRRVRFPAASAPPAA